MRPGRTRPYRNMRALPIPEDFPLPTCIKCRTEVLDKETHAKLAPLLLEEYRSALRRRIRRIIDALTGHTSQRKLELLLGLSQGYLSRLRSGSGNPSPELVSHLALIAKDPSVRLLELQRYWEEPPSETDP